MTVYAAAYVPANGADTAATKRLMVYNQEIAWEAGHRAEIRPYLLNVNADVDSILIAAKAATSNRWYVQKIEFEANDTGYPGDAVPEDEFRWCQMGEQGRTAGGRLEFRDCGQTYFRSYRTVATG